MDIVIFGAGQIGRQAEKTLRGETMRVMYFLDNSQKLLGNKINGIEVINLEQYMQKGMKYQIVIACVTKYQIEIERQLESYGIKNYVFFDKLAFYKKERLISYCQPKDMEDIILYHVLKEEDNIFYIDIGSNDPFTGSVTRLLYERGGRGINIEPQEEYFTLMLSERPEDINLCIGIGEKEERRVLHIQGGLSTLKKENVLFHKCNEREITILPLKSVCDTYIKEEQVISFLKIDVEGAEKEVLMGADFTKYRPYIILIESTLPNTNIPCYGEWEYILFQNHYHYVYTCGVNRYYVADEVMHLDKRFRHIDRIEDFYNIFLAKIVFLK